MAHGDQAARQPELRLDDLVAELRARGLRVTTARLRVLEQLAAAGDAHLSTDELAERVAATTPGVHLSTIYRTCDALVDAGILAPAPLADGRSSFHLAGDAHHHAVCTRCGATVSLPPEVLEPLRRRLSRDHGFEADPHHLTITGLCRRCAR